MATGHHHHHHQRWAEHVFPLPDHQIYARIYCRRKSTLIFLQIYSIFDDAKKASHTRVYTRIQLINWQTNVFLLCFLDSCNLSEGRECWHAEYGRGCAVYLGTGPHTSQEGSGRRVVTLRILLMNGPRRRSADRWPSRSPTWTKAPPRLDFASASPYYLISYPSSRAGKWLLRKILSVQFLATICPVSTSSSQSFVFHKSVMEFVY